MELYFGGTIYTMRQQYEVVEAVLVKEGVIQQVGTYAQLAPLATTFIDLNKATMLPGLVDSHVHLIGIGEKLSRLQLGDVQSLSEMTSRLMAAAATLAPGEWLVAEGWNEFALPNAQMLTLAELDAITQHPVILHRACHHVALVNSTALHMAGFTHDEPTIARSTIGRNAQGELNGFLYEEAVQLVEALRREEGRAYIEHLQHCVTHAVDHLHTDLLALTRKIVLITVISITLYKRIGKQLAYNNIFVSIYCAIIKCLRKWSRHKYSQ